MADKEKKESNPTEEELNRLKARVGQLEELVAQRNREFSKLEQAIADKDTQIGGLKQSLTEADEQAKKTKDSLAQAVASYKALVIRANPEAPEELINGDTIEAVDQSLAKAKKLVSKVKQGLEAEAMQTRFPGGAPVRTPPDLSALSAKEKIQYAIGGASP